MAKALLSAHTALLVKASVKLTSDVAVVANKVYYKADTTTTTVYVAVEKPVVADIDEYYEIVADGTTGATQALVRIVCIKDVPDLGGDPETIETTDLCDTAQTFIDGIATSDMLSFTANYHAGVLYTINKIMGNGERDCAIVFGNLAGIDGKFEFAGKVSARVNGFGVNEVREMTINVVPTTSIEQASPIGD